MTARLVKSPTELRFSEWLLLRRRQLNISQKGLAEALELSTQTVGNWEKERSVPTLTLWQTVKLCEILQCHLEDIPLDEGPQVDAKA